MSPGEPLNHPLLNRTIERAQTKVEERNFEIRKHLLDYDDVLNEQRKFIYAWRDEILTDPALRERVFTTAAELVDEILEPYDKTRGEDPEVLTDVLRELKTQFLYTPEKPMDDLSGLPPQALRSIIMEDLRNDLDHKTGILGEEYLNMVIRFEYLKAIDSKWQDHLENLEALREAVYLRSYGQKNPLLEYKLEGFQIFDQLLYDIRAGIARKMFMIRVESSKPVGIHARTPVGTASHNRMSAFGSGREPGPAQPENVQISRTLPKVGRNDTCPCGSGKKYKYCHGR